MKGWSYLMKRFSIRVCFYFFIIFANVAMAQFTTFEFPSFPAAVNFAKTDTAELVLSSRATISSSLQVPKTVSVRVQQAGALTSIQEKRCALSAPSMPNHTKSLRAAAPSHSIVAR